MFLIVPWTSRNYVRVSESGADIKCISYPIIILRKHHEHNEWWWNIMKHQLEKRTKHSWPATTKQNSSETNHLALSKNIRKTPKTIPILRKSWQKSHSLNGKMAIKLWRHRGKSTIFGPNPRAFHPDSIPPLRGKISESCHARTIADLMRISVTSKNRYPTTVTINVICKKKKKRYVRSRLWSKLFRLAWS